MHISHLYYLLYNNLHHHNPLDLKFGNQKVFYLKVFYLGDLINLETKNILEGQSLYNFPVSTNTLLHLPP